MHRWVVVVVIGLVACSRAEQNDCEKKAAQLAAWVKTLASEGHAVFTSQHDLIPVVAKDVPPASLSPAPVVMVTAEWVTYSGQLIGTHEQLVIDALVERLTVTRDLLEKDGLEPAVAVLADRNAPWASIAAIGRAATLAGITRLRFVFRGATKLTEPAASWLDAESGPLYQDLDPERPAADLGETVRRLEDPKRRRVFDRCPSGRALFDGLDERAGETGDRGALIAEGIAKAYRECGCAEELGAVQRMMWNLWSREQNNMPHAEVVVTLSTDAPRLELSGDTPWSKAHEAIVERAGRGPIAF